MVSKQVKFRPSQLFCTGCLSLHSCQTAMLLARNGTVHLQINKLIQIVYIKTNLNLHKSSTSYHVCASACENGLTYRKWAQRAFFGSTVARRSARIKLGDLLMGIARKPLLILDIMDTTCLYCHIIHNHVAWCQIRFFLTIINESNCPPHSNMFHLQVTRQVKNDKAPRQHRNADENNGLLRVCYWEVVFFFQFHNWNIHLPTVTWFHLPGIWFFFGSKLALHFNYGRRPL